MSTQFRTIQSACLADWGPAIETTVRRIAVLVAFTYAAGYCFGQWLHRTNDRLSRAYVALLGLSEPKPVVSTPKSIEAPVSAPEAVQCTLTVVELRKLARAQGIKQVGGRRIAQATKSALLEALN